jgi:hypothetical protein
MTLSSEDCGAAAPDEDCADSAPNKWGAIAQAQPTAHAVEAAIQRTLGIRGTGPHLYIGIGRRYCTLGQQEKP